MKDNVRKRTNPYRIQVYLPPDEREIWEQALALSPYDSLSGMLRDLVRKYHKAEMKRAGKSCPE